MQQGGGGGGGGHQSQYGERGIQGTGTGESSSHMVNEQSEQIVEAASPISSRPPVGSGNLEELMRLASGGRDEGGGCGFASGNRWPRQETVALLQIRSDMDAVFRDATVKGPLWEDVSRKLAELGYKRSAKKCREKFENVHKYYKRTKEGRAGRQHGKTYKFFNQLEAFHTTNSTAAANLSTPATLDVAPISVGIPMPISSSVQLRIPPTTAIPVSSSMLPMPGSAPAPAGPVPAAPSAPHTTAPFGISFSSNSSSSSRGFDDHDDDAQLGGEASNMAGTSRKRKRLLGGDSSSSRRMMEFLPVLMKQVMQKQEAMQQRFLEAIEKREQDRMIREEAWKRQELARLARENEVTAQERAIAASRDAAIISFLEKITGQTIQLPTTLTVIPAPPPPQPPPTQTVAPVAPPAAPPLHQPPSLPHQPLQQPRRSQPQQQQQQPQPQNEEAVRHHHQQPISSEVVITVPKQQFPPPEIGGSGGGSLEPSSSRWPKAEVLALINLRSELESRYQEAGPKGPLWEDISAGMLRMGYKRSAKRCKEKWENINKYFKKVKESNKKRPEDAKTCPYFHQLDALYRNKTLGGGTSGGSSSISDQKEDHQDTSDAPPITVAPPPHLSTHLTDDQPGNKNGDSGAAKKPEDIVREQGMHQKQHQLGQSFLVEGYGKIDELDSDNMDMEEEGIEDDEDEDDGELEQERKMAYKIEFQRQNARNPNGGGNGATSFLQAMVQ